MTDTVAIRDLKVSAVIGVYEWEREAEQELTLAVSMRTDVAQAARRDDIADALDYSAVAALVRNIVTQGRFQLIETAAERVAGAIVAEYGLPWVRVEVAKPIKDEGYTAVIAVERGTHQAKLL